MPIDAHTQALIARAKRAAPLSVAEELECIRAWQARRDRRAAGRIVEANSRQVAFTALKFKSYGVPVADLMSDGQLGLMKALDRFDEDKSVRFSTYAGYWIRAEIIGCVLSGWSLLSGPKSALNSRVFFRLRRQRALLESALSAGAGAREEVTASLAREFGVSERRMTDMLHQIDHRGVSLDARDGADGATLLDALASDTNQEQRLADAERCRILERAVERARPALDWREAIIVEQRLLADPEDCLSLAELGVRFGVSRERVRQLEVRARGRLRAEALRESDPGGTDGAGGEARAA